MLALLGAKAAHAEDRSAPGELATISVPPGSLEQGLTALGRQTNLKLVYPSALTAGKKTVGVAGRMAAKDAVSRLLAQTGLGFTLTSTGAVQIASLSARQGASRSGRDPAGDNQYRGRGHTRRSSLWVRAGNGDRTRNPQQVISASKTGTKLADIPGSVQTIPHELLYEQGATMLRQSLDNASGVNFGGPD